VDRVDGGVPPAELRRRAAGERGSGGRNGSGGGGARLPRIG
jgi:hypothetical protein